MFCTHDPLELMRFAEGSAEAADLPKIQDQLRQCNHCQKLLAELLETGATLKQLRQPELPPVESERWVHHLRRARQRRTASAWKLTWLARLRPSPIVALLTMVLLFFSYHVILQKPAVAPNTQDELRLLLREHAIAQDQSAIPAETLSELLITENSRVPNR